jgi:hypothetical protein
MTIRYNCPNIFLGFLLNNLSLITYLTVLVILKCCDFIFDVMYFDPHFVFLTNFVLFIKHRLTCLLSLKNLVNNTRE